MANQPKIRANQLVAAVQKDVRNGRYEPETRGKRAGAGVSHCRNQFGRSAFFIGPNMDHILYPRVRNAAVFIKRQQFGGAGGGQPAEPDLCRWKAGLIDDDGRHHFAGQARKQVSDRKEW
ncbi:hypothetical protein [Agrobacterium sp.]|uniref:hypothetical protein n=1 Tax=Agrobacterium sp. TaxID=361 RepID=UPI002899006F|nr:hypothetical protein [Agrobacterium sp.]